MVVYVNEPSAADIEAVEADGDPVAQVIQLRQRLAAVQPVLDEARSLNRRVAAFIDRVAGPTPLAEIRAAMNDVGVQQARRTLEVDAVDAVAHALEGLRHAQEIERSVKDALAEAVIEASWALGAHFVSRSNKQWLTVDIDGTEIPEADQKSYDAAARKEWIDVHAARQQPVQLAARAVRDAEERTFQARDALAIAEKRFTAARHSLDAAAAQLTALIRATPRETL